MTASAELTWSCVACRGPVPMAADACPACGWSLRDGEPAVVSERSRRRLRGIGLAVRELVIVNLLFVLWRIVGDHTLGDARSAVSHGLAVWRFERSLHLPDERSVQQLLIGHTGVVRGMDEYYAWAHIASMVALLVWLWWRHRSAYAGWRNVVVAYTTVGLLISLIPVAPPRLLPATGLVDTALRDHTSVYAGLGRGITDQVSAMPSMHVGWATLIAVAVIATGRSRWRWLVLIQPVVTVLVVVSTGNHFWLDGVAALLLLGAVLGLVQLRAVRGSALLRHVELPRRLGQRSGDGRVDREGVGELVDGEVVLHGQ